MEKNQNPIRTIKTKYRSIECFVTGVENLDEKTVKSFAQEWKNFHSFNIDEIDKIGNQYFDIVNEDMMNKDSIVIDIGCGSGRWTQYVHNKVKYVVAIDPSESILQADELLKNAQNVELCQASISNIPFEDKFFDFAFCLGVLHHLPNPEQGIRACVNKLKIGGYFLTYIYYNLDNRGILYRAIFMISDLVRGTISKLPSVPKKVLCSLLSIIVYLPLVLLSRTLKSIGVQKDVRRKIPLSFYEDKSFYVIRNDSLDRFGTPLEKRFSKNQIQQMLQNAELTDINFSENPPYWHVVGRKK